MKLLQITDRDKMCQVVLNQRWEWATISQRIWYFSPQATIADAEAYRQSILSRGIAAVSEVDLACPLTLK